MIRPEVIHGHTCHWVLAVLVRLLPIQLSCLIYYPFTNIGRVEVEKVRAAAKEELESAVAAVEARAAADAAAHVDKVRTEARAELEREVAALKVTAATDAASQVEAAAESERIEVVFFANGSRCDFRLSIAAISLLFRA